MKKHLLFTLFFLYSANASAYCITNYTDAKVEVSINYKDWWLNHSKTIKPHQTYCSMSGLAPGERANYFFSWELSLPSTLETRTMLLKGFTNSNMTVTGFGELFEAHFG